MRRESVKSDCKREKNFIDSREKFDHFYELRDFVLIDQVELEIRLYIQSTRKVQCTVDYIHHVISQAVLYRQNSFSYAIQVGYIMLPRARVHERSLKHVQSR